MKIVCDSCGTKYSIADDKVRGKVFKIRCKKCAHIIIVRGNEDQAAESSPSTSELDALQAEAGGGSQFDQKETRVFDYSGFDGAEAPAPQQGYAGAEPVWHCVIDREQVGPMTEDELRDRLRNGEVDVETYVWREGFGDWMRLSTVAELAHVLGDSPQTIAEGTERRPVPEAPARNGSGLHYGSVAPGRSAPDLFATDGGRGGEAPMPLFTAPPSADDDMFALPGRGGSGLHDEPDPEPAPRARRLPPVDQDAGGMGGGLEAAGEQRMTGQRNENSVLFSLNNLSALAAPAAAAAPGAPKASPMQNGGTTEGSGLIDIRAMAATTLGIDQRRAQASGGSVGAMPGQATDDELPSIGFSPVASSPLLMPSAPKPSVPPWVWAVVGGAFLLLVGAVVLALQVFRTPTPTPTALPIAAAPPPATAVPSAAVPAAAAPTAATPTPPTKAESAVAAKETKGDKKDKKGKDAKVAKADKPDRKESPGAAALPPTSADPPAPKEAAEPPRKKGKKDDLDDLLNGATGGKKSHSPKPTAADADEAPVRKKEPAVDPNLPSQLSQAQVMTGIKRVKGTVQGCFDKYKEQGLVQVKITIAPSGGVTASQVTGKFAGTQTGDCVGTAVKAAKFEKFSGSPMAITYPFMLR